MILIVGPVILGFFATCIDWIIEGRSIKPYVKNMADWFFRVWGTYTVLFGVAGGFIVKCSGA